MPIYQFEAMDATGMEIRDTIEAPNEAEAQATIRQMGYFVTKITRKRPEARPEEIRKLRKKYNKMLNPNAVSIFVKNYGPIIGAFIVGILFGFMLGRL